jgi:hypothetical protein
MTILRDDSEETLYELLLPLYPLTTDEHVADLWGQQGEALLDQFTSVVSEHMPKLILSMQLLLKEGWKLRLTILGVACEPPGEVSNEIGDWLQGEEWPWAAYFCRIGLPLYPMEPCGAPRGLVEIMEASSEADDRVWYERSCRNMIHTQDHPMNPVVAIPPPDILSGALRAQMRMEEKYGQESLRESSEDNFDIGMLNGKLSALRWLLGSPWDMLDT